MKRLLSRLNLRFDLGELSGSLGDMGTFLPLAVGLSVQCGMDFGYILLFAGLMNLASGLIFGIPVAVQPMKVIAAVAIAESLNPQTIAAAGLLAGAIVLIVGATGLAGKISDIIPKAIVRGIQLAIGIKLFWAGSRYIYNSGLRFEFDSVFMAVFAIGLILISFKFKRIPAALFVFGLGIAIVLLADRSVVHNLTIGSTLPGFLYFFGSDFSTGFTKGTVPQIPLTLLNSVVAVCALSGDLFAKRRLPENKISLSVGIMNLIACPLGGMPMCHGAGGLAAQYRFGARTGGSVVLLGLAKITLALLFGSSLLTLIAAFPASILGAMLLFAGWQMAVVCKDIRGKMTSALFAATAAMCLVLGMAWGVGIGFALYLIIGGSSFESEARIESASTGRNTEREQCLAETT